MACTLTSAERVLHRSRLGPATFQRFSVDVLRQLCTAHGLHVVPTGRRVLRTGEQQTLKADYIRALLDHVSNVQTIYCNWIGILIST